MLKLSDRAFLRLSQLFLQASGIRLTPDKHAMVEARLRGRVVALQLSSFEAYCAHIDQLEHRGERQQAIDLLTTNETYFFREPAHFQLLGELAVSEFQGRSMRIWSAACSTGEEPYSIAMTLLDKRPDGAWEVRASDLATRVIERACAGIFPLQRIEHLPPEYLKRFALRGTGAYEGSFRIADEVRQRVQFFRHNLLQDAAALGLFDVIFLRNVLIYFDAASKQQILERVLERLRPRGLFFIGSAEALQGHTLPLERISHSVYRKR
jgi:chemotaxis protein methyltransferase CheR